MRKVIVEISPKGKLKSEWAQKRFGNEDEFTQAYWELCRMKRTGELDLIDIQYRAKAIAAMSGCPAGVRERLKGI